VCFFSDFALIFQFSYLLFIALEFIGVEGNSQLHAPAALSSGIRTSGTEVGSWVGLKIMDILPKKSILPVSGVKPGWSSVYRLRCSAFQ
jgi:hypothetical protein